MYSIMVTIITNLFRLYINKRFIYIFFDSKDINKKLEFSAYLFFYLFTTSTYFIFNYPPVNIITNVLGLYIVTFVYPSSHKKKLLIVCIIYIINMVSDVLCVYLISDYIWGGELNVNTSFITLLLIAICEQLAEKIINKQTYNFFELKQWKILIVIPLCSVLILFILLINTGSNRSITIIMCLGILIINMMVFYLYNALVNSYLLLTENAVFKQQTEIYSRQLDILMQSNNKIRALQHDMKNHMLQLKMIAKKEQAHEVIDYISHMNKFASNPDEYVHTGNKDIDSILNYMIHKAVCDSINVTEKIVIPENINIKAFDLNVILGNLLDNAIQALQTEKNKHLNISLIYEKGVLYINISNNYSGKVKEDNNILYTIKKDKENHGIGLSNVKKIVNMYNGTIEIKHDNNEFKVEIMLYTPR